MTLDNNHFDVASVIKNQGLFSFSAKSSCKYFQNQQFALK